MPRSDFRILRDYMRELYEHRNRRRERRRRERRQHPAGLGAIAGVDRRHRDRRSGRERRRNW